MFDSLKKHKGVIYSNKKLSNTLNHIVIKTEDYISFEPGDYITLFIGGYVPRNYSIANISSPSKNIEIIINTSTPGVGARELKDIKSGVEINFLEPFGNFKYKKNKYSWFIAVGSGISPLIPMIHQAKIDLSNIKIFFGAREEFDIPDLSFLDIPINYTITKPSDEWKGDVGRVQLILKKELDKNKNILNKIYFYICGQPIMINHTLDLLQNNNIKNENIIFEKYSL